MMENGKDISVSSFVSILSVNISPFLFTIFLLCNPRWQARREGDRSTRAGLIPSRAHQERMILRERSQIGKGAEQGEVQSVFSNHTH